LQELGLQELKAMKLTSPTTQPQSFSVKRITRAYPVYFKGYKNIVSTAMDALKLFPNLIVTGRNGLYKWNNMHHSVKTGILAARNVLGEKNDLQVVKGMVAIGKDSD
jgi:protoporphyrinogen oxidase